MEQIKYSRNQKGINIWENKLKYESTRVVNKSYYNLTVIVKWVPWWYKKFTNDWWKYIKFKSSIGWYIYKKKIGEIDSTCTIDNY